MLGPVLVVILGGALGASTVTGSGDPMSLRVPSLFAALLMVAQGAVDLAKAQRQRRRVLEAPATAITLPAQQGALTPAGGGQRTMNVPAGSRPGQHGPDHAEIVIARAVYAPPTPPPKPPTPASNSSVPLGLLALALWLALAVLMTSSSLSWLSVLATIAAFLLFALGWELLTGIKQQ